MKAVRKTDLVNRLVQTSRTRSFVAQVRCRLLAPWLPPSCKQKSNPNKITERCARDPWRSRFFRGSFALELSHLESLWQSWRTHFFGETSCENSLVARGLLFSSFLDLGFSSDEVTNENLCGSPTVDKFNVPKNYLERLDPEISFLAECIQESVCTTWS